MVVVFGATLPITVFSYDTLAHWDGYSLTLPVSRRQLVTSKYLLGLMLSTAGFVLSALINLAGEGPDPQRLWILLPLIFLAGSVLYLSILLPLVYQFGAEKSRLMMMLILILPFGIAAIYESWRELRLYRPARSPAGCRPVPRAAVHPGAVLVDQLQDI